jgi:hypothetical protein
MKLNASAASIFVLAGVALSSQPALSQSAMGGAPGGPTMAPAPVRQAPTDIPSPAPAASTNLLTPMNNGLSARPRAAGISENESPRPSDRNLPVANGTTGNGLKQEPSKAPLPPGYAYDANGRIGFVGNANEKTGGGTAPSIVYPPALSHGGNPTTGAGLYGILNNTSSSGVAPTDANAIPKGRPSTGDTK